MKSTSLLQICKIPNNTGVVPMRPASLAFNLAIQVRLHAHDSHHGQRDDQHASFRHAPTYPHRRRRTTERSVRIQRALAPDPARLTLPLHTAVYRRLLRPTRRITILPTRLRGARRGVIGDCVAGTAALECGIAIREVAVQGRGA